MTEREWICIGYENKVIEKLEGDIMTFREVYGRWFVYKMGQIKPQSLDRIECTFNRYYKDADIADMHISDIGEQEVVGFLNSVFSLYGSLSLKEYRKLYQIVNNVLCYAVDYNISGARLLNWKKVQEYTYLNHVVCPKRDEVRIRDEDVEKLRDFVLSGGYLEKQSASLLLLFNFYVGLRVGELAALKWQDIDFARNLLNVSKSEVKSYGRDADGHKTGSMSYRVSGPKTSKSVRLVPLCRDAVSLLKLLRAHHDRMGYQTELLLYDGRDCIGVRSLDRTLRRLCGLCGIQAFNTHMIRKTFATKLHHAGLPTRIIADIMGHAEIATTERCYILSDLEYFAALSGSLNDALIYGEVKKNGD